MIAWHALALSMGAWFMSLFGLVHTAVGIGLLYYTLAGFLNTTSIRVGRGSMNIRIGPIPWPGNKTLDTFDLEQFFCTEKIQHGKNGPNYSYEVHAVDKHNVQKSIVTGLGDANQALYLEQELERFLDIEDQPVAGEISR